MNYEKNLKEYFIQKYLIPTLGYLFLFVCAIATSFVLWLMFVLIFSSEG